MTLLLFYDIIFIKNKKEEFQVNFCKIINYDTANARGLSVVLFVSGCSHHCKECHNPET